VCQILFLRFSNQPPRTCPRDTLAVEIVDRLQQLPMALLIVLVKVIIIVLVVTGIQLVGQLGRQGTLPRAHHA
jgi:hypothetical protein